MEVVFGPRQLVINRDSTQNPGRGVNERNRLFSTLGTAAIPCEGWLDLTSVVVVETSR